MFPRFELHTDAASLATWAGICRSSLYQSYLEDLPRNRKLAPVLRATGASGERDLVWMQQGLIPAYACDDRGAEQRAEAHTESLTCESCFRSAFRRRRCIVPATVLHEQRHMATGMEKPCSFAPESGGIFGIAAVWETWTNDHGHKVESFAIIKAEVTPLLRTLFDRLPVVLDGPEQYERWLLAGKIDEPPVDLLKPLSTVQLRSWRMMPGPAELHLQNPHRPDADGRPLDRSH